MTCVLCVFDPSLGRATVLDTLFIRLEIVVAEDFFFKISEKDGEIEKKRNRNMT